MLEQAWTGMDEAPFCWLSSTWEIRTNRPGACNPPQPFRVVDYRQPNLPMPRKNSWYLGFVRPETMHYQLDTEHKSRTRSTAVLNSNHDSVNKGCRIQVVKTDNPRGPTRELPSTAWPIQPYLCRIYKKERIILGNILAMEGI